MPTVDRRPRLSLVPDERDDETLRGGWSLKGMPAWLLREKRLQPIVIVVVVVVVL